MHALPRRWTGASAETDRSGAARGSGADYVSVSPPPLIDSPRELKNSPRGHHARRLPMSPLGPGARLPQDALDRDSSRRRACIVWLLASTLAVVLTAALINTLVWRQSPGSPSVQAAPGENQIVKLRAQMKKMKAQIGRLRHELVSNETHRKAEGPDDRLVASEGTTTHAAAAMTGRGGAVALAGAWTTTTTTTQTPTPTRTSTSMLRPTTTTTQSVVTATTRRAPHPRSLFCFCVMRSTGYEPSLVRTQLARNVGVFACDEYAVYSDTRKWLSPGPPTRIETSVIEANLTAAPGVKEHILNTEIFLQAWRRVFSDGQFRKHGWTVKVDPDAVFIAERLKANLRTVPRPTGKGLYLINCKYSFGLFGAVEVLSRDAVRTYSEGTQRCKDELNWRGWGEDLFLRKCLDHLGVERAEDYRLLSDGYCNEVPSPCTSGKVTFHPFKTPEAYFLCLSETKHTHAAA